MQNPLLITVNIGSTSKKYAIFRGIEQLVTLTIEKDEHTDNFIARDSFTDTPEPITEYDYKYTLAYLEQIITGNNFGALADVEAVLMRVVAPGEFFQGHHKMDESYFAVLEKAAESAPLHLALQRSEYDQMIAHLREKGLAEKIAIWGMSDSAFHKTMPDAATRYGIARSDAKEFGIRRFGYHGLSFGSVARMTSELLGGTPERMIICHLGGGASVVSVVEGRSVNTSMGMTPLEGLLMARRAGDIDAGALLALMDARDWGVDEARAYLNRDCGLLGVSGTSDDLRALLMRESTGDGAAKEAIDLFVHKVRHYIGAYGFDAGGINVLVFTGTIGERAHGIRERILQGLEGVGIIFDASKNDSLTETGQSGKGAFIHADNSQTKIVIMPTDEFGEMARAYLDAYHQLKAE